MRPFLLRFRCRGVGLLELMLSLIVIVSLLFLATRYFKTADESLRVSRAESMMNTITAASYKWLEGNPNFATTDFNIQQLVTLSLLPKNYGDGMGINPWGGDISVCDANSSGNTAHVRIILYNIPHKSCRSLKEKIHSTDEDCYQNRQYGFCERPPNSTAWNFYAVF